MQKVTVHWINYREHFSLVVVSSMAGARARPRNHHRSTCTFHFKNFKAALHYRYLFAMIHVLITD